MIVEDGTGLANSDSYATLAQADAFYASRNLIAWTGSPAEKSAALVRATDYIDANYRPHGSPKIDTQALQWPRDDQATVPAPVVRATVMLAMVALIGPLLKPSERGVTSLKLGSKLGTKETVYDGPVTDPYSYVTNILAPLARLRGADSGSTLTIGRLLP